MKTATRSKSGLSLYREKRSRAKIERHARDLDALMEVACHPQADVARLARCLILNTTGPKHWRI